MSASQNNMDIDFLSNEWYEPHRRKVVWFTAVCDEKTIDCGVTIEALVEHFHAFQDDPLPAFRKHRQEIWSMADNLITRRRFEADGTVLIRSADVQHA